MSDNTASPLRSGIATETLVAWATDLTNDDRSPHTIRAYEHAIHHFLQWYEAEAQCVLTLDDLTPIVLIGYRNSLQHHQVKAVSTVNTHVAALRAWCLWLYEQQHIRTNPAARLKFVGRQPPPAPKGLSDQAINALLRKTQRTHDPGRDYAIVQLLLQTGMRIGECATLNYEDIVFGERSGMVQIRGGKGNKARKVPLNGSARTALAEYAGPILGVAPTIAAVAPVWPHRPRIMSPTPLWRSRRSSRLSVQAIRRMIDEAVKSCAQRRLVPPDTSAHTLRHTFAMRYLKQTPGDLIGLATLLGHSSLETTRMYGQMTDEQLTARVERLDINAYI